MTCFSKLRGLGQIIGAEGYNLLCVVKLTLIGRYLTTGDVILYPDLPETTTTDHTSMLKPPVQLALKILLSEHAARVKTRVRTILITCPNV